MDEVGLIAETAFENDSQGFAPGLQCQLPQCVVQAGQTRKTFGGVRERLFEAPFEMAGAPPPAAGQGLDALVRGIVEPFDQCILSLFSTLVVGIVLIKSGTQKKASSKQEVAHAAV